MTAGGSCAVLRRWMRSVLVWSTHHPPPTQPLNGLHHILPPTDHPDTTGCNLSKKSVIFSCACTILVTNPSQLANANIQICRVPMIQICAIDAIVELSASLPGDAPAYQSGFNFSFWLTPPVYVRSTTEYTKGCKAKSYMVSRTTSHRMELNHGKFRKIFSSRTPAIVWKSDETGHFYQTK